MMWQNHWTVIERLEKELALARQELKEERERNRKREDDLVDRILTKSNSRPITPEEPSKPVQRPLSKIEVDRIQDMMKEELEHRNLNPEAVTPDVRGQLDDILDELIKEQRPFQFQQ